MLESMIDINVKKCLETISQCHRLLYCSITVLQTVLLLFTKRTSCSFGNSLTLLEGGTCRSFSPRAPDDRFFPFGGGGLQWTFRFRLSSEGRGHFNRSSKETVLEIVLSESDVGIELEVAELQATELELSSVMLSLLPLT